MMNCVSWIDHRTGLVVAEEFSAARRGGPFVWATTMAFVGRTASTGMVLSNVHRAGAQSAWESVYYVHAVPGGLAAPRDALLHGPGGAGTGRASTSCHDPPAAIIARRRELTSSGPP